jgi:hypothetical protein
VVGGGVAFASAAVTLVASATIFVPMVMGKRLGSKPLLVGGVFYVAYLLLVVVTLAGPRV